MQRIALIALAIYVATGCTKVRDEPASGGANNQGGSGFGAVQAVRGAATRTVTAAELKDLHLFMSNAKLALGRVPTAQETWAEISQPSGNTKLTQMIREGLIVLVPNPADEGLWAYDKNAPTQGGWILMHSEPRRVTAQEFAQLSQQ